MNCTNSARASRKIVLLAGAVEVEVGVDGVDVAPDFSLVLVDVEGEVAAVLESFIPSWKKRTQTRGKF